MYAARRGNSCQDVCNHMQTVENDRDGECTCTECGLVLTPLYYEQHFSDKTNNEIYNEIKEYITDICYNANIPNNVIVASFKYYKELKGNSNLCFNNKILAAYSIYESLNKMEIPRLAEEVAHYAGVKVNKIWRVESTLTLSDPLNEPTQYVERYCTILKIPYSDQKKIKMLIRDIQEKFNLGCLRSNCLVAAVTHLYCLKKKLKLSLKLICTTCSISTTSVHRIIRKLKCNTEFKEWWSCQPMISI